MTVFEASFIRHHHAAGKAAQWIQMRLAERDAAYLTLEAIRGQIELIDAIEAVETDPRPVRRIAGNLGPDARSDRGRTGPLRPAGG